MIQIREGTFETNSSSTHSICIAKDSTAKNWKIPNYLNIKFDDFGWERCEYNDMEDKVSYLASAMKYCELEAEFEHFVEIMQGLGIRVHVKEYYDEGVDHSGELIDFIHDVLSDRDKLMRFLFDDRSCIYTGNDNGCDDDEMCWCALDKIYDYENDKEIDNPNHDESKFEYYFKGN